jgi:hypothetical protein
MGGKGWPQTQLGILDQGLAISIENSFRDANPSLSRGLTMFQDSKTGERRRQKRRPAALPVALCDEQWRILARGRTSNISDGGVSIVAEARRHVPDSGPVNIEITEPGDPLAKGPAGRCRIVRYAGRIARTQQLGNLLGLGIELGHPTR